MNTRSKSTISNDVDAAEAWRRVTDRLLTVAAILFIITASVAFVVLPRDIDNDRMAQLALQRVEALNSMMRSLASDAIARGYVSLAARHRLASCEAQAAGEVAALGGVGVDSSAVKGVAHTSDLAKSSIDDVIRLVARGQTDEALRLADEQSDARFRNLESAIGSANAALDKAAVAAKRNAAIAAAGSVVAIFVSFGVLLRRFERRGQNHFTLSAERRLLRYNEARFHSLVENACDIIAIIDRPGNIRYMSPAANRVLGIAPSSLIGCKFYNIVHHDDVDHARNIVAQAAGDHGSKVSSELRLQHQDGSFRDAEIILINQFSQREVNGIVATLRDITERKQFEAQLTHHAFHDALTGLPNRALFLDRLSLALSRTARSDNPVAVVFIDLDSFKVVNDSLGHQAGDHMLLEVTRRLQTCLRPDDTLARLGGDEFTILIENATDNAAQVVAQRILKVLEQAIYIQDQACFTSASIGIAISERSDDIPQFLLRDADTAMYEAKHNGKGRYCVFDRSMSTKAAERLEMEGELRTAVERGEICLFYQPIVSLETERITGVEALMRWNHPARGVLPPAKFIPIAEESGAIVQLGRYVLNEACRQLTEWRESYPEAGELTMSVNISPKQFEDADLVQNIAAVIEETGVTPSSLKLEITENLTFADANKICDKLDQIKRMGVQIAIDDFGTGYSSMAYLKNFPIDSVKIDRSFVNRLGSDSSDDAIIMAIITLARAMRLDVTSEGIETEEQRSRLIGLGCEYGQGYLFARPASGPEISRRLADQSRPQITRKAA